MYYVFIISQALQKQQVLLENLTRKLKMEEVSIDFLENLCYTEKVRRKTAYIKFLMD